MGGSGYCSDVYQVISGHLLGVSQRCGRILIMKDVTDIAEMRSCGYLKVLEYSNWRARQLGQTRKIALTNKGIREFFNTMVKAQG